MLDTVGGGLRPRLAQVLALEKARVSRTHKRCVKTLDTQEVCWTRAGHAGGVSGTSWTHTRGLKRVLDTRNMSSYIYGNTFNTPFKEDLAMKMKTSIQAAIND